jgi:RHS repeat-associated protein
LGDALGSLRQLAGDTGAVALARIYKPYGDPLSSVGTGTSIFQFTGQQVDGTALVYLRARYYGSFGRFLSRDVWEGDPSQPMSYNTWLYVYSNPIVQVDPTGRWVDPCEHIANPSRRRECQSEVLRHWEARTPPPYLAWFPSSGLPVVQDLGLGGSVGAQFNVPGFLAYWDPSGQGHRNALCGQISLAAVFGNDAQSVVGAWVEFAARTRP